MRRFFPRKEEEVRPEEIIKVIKKEPKDEGLEKDPRPRREALPRGIFWGLAGLVVLFVGGFIVAFYIVRAKVNESISLDAATLRNGIMDLQNLDPAAAREKFSSLTNVSPSDLGDIFGALGSLWKGQMGAISSFTDLARQLTLFSGELNDISSSSFAFFLEGRGDAFLADLGRLRDTVDGIDSSGNQLFNAISAVPGSPLLGSGDAYLSLKSQIGSARAFLDAFVPWFSEPAPHHFLVLFQNPSEIRPAGGFLGSYADITVASGSITNIDVRDIADADAAFSQKIIPPKPLQLIVTKWRPADANWFFDFPTSASKTTAFFEESGLYAKASTTFDGAIAISPKVVSDLLSVTGPVTLGNPSATFTSDNFLVQIQKIVQAGQATSATYPKQVLRDLSAEIFAQLASSTAAERGDLFNMALDWGLGKDVMFYFKDPAMENFAKLYGVGGDVYELPQKFNGDYFAPVDANVGGGKSDLYVSSTVSYIGQINPDGTLTGHVAVTRKHNGAKGPYWWYRVTNQDYMEFFVPDGTSLVNVAGGIQKKIAAPINYAKNGYTTDPLVASIEGTEQSLFAYPGVSWHEESGKQVFTTWSTVKAGATAQFSLDYTHRLFIPPAPGVQYEFVFEKQAGTSRSYSIEIDAPLGYVFAENGLASFMYKTNDLPGRFIVNLTLQSL